ncbi:MAG: arsenate reductase ArsC [Halanaerobium sp.]
MKKTKVLFLCTGNSCRSQIAEAYLRKYAGDKYEVYSAGLEAQGIHPKTIKVMAEAGIDISSQKSKSLKKYLGKKHFGFLITVCARAEEECPVFPDVSTRFYWPFDDPRAAEGSEEEILNKFREVRDQIEQRIKEFIEEREN